MSSATDDAESESSAESSDTQEEVNELMKKVAEQLEQEIIDGAIELESLGQQLIIRIRENGAFPSGSAYLQNQFKPIILKIALLLNDVPGEIYIAGHTDDVNVTNELFINNWDLSSKRAVAVATEIVKAPQFDKDRIQVVGHADTRPLVPNTTDQNRRRNRRVEISIMQGKALESEPINLSTIE